MANKDNEYDYHHDYYHRRHYKGGNLGLLILFWAIMTGQIGAFFTSKAFLVIVAIVSFLAIMLPAAKLDNWARKHSSPKVRKTRNWIIGIIFFVLAVMFYVVALHPDLVAKWLS